MLLLLDGTDVVDDDIASYSFVCISLLLDVVLVVVSDEDIVVLFIGEFESVDTDVESGLLLELKLDLESAVVVFVGNDVDVISLGIEDGIDVELSFVISLLVVG